MAKSRIKKPKAIRQGKVQAIEPSLDYNKTAILFSLERMPPSNYCFSKLDIDDKAMFADSIFRRRNLKWNEVIQAPKHGLGTEKIPRKQLNVGTDNIAGVTEDVENFLVLRFSGKKPMVGYRHKSIFYVLWFDHDFSLYKHE